MMNIIQQVTDPMPTNLSYIVSAMLVLEKSLMLMLYRIGRLNQRIIEDAKKSN